MTEKKFTKFELARMKRTAQNVDQYLNKKNKLVAKISDLQKELDGIVQLIELTDAPTKAMTGGYGTEDIIKKVITLTDKLDKNGNVLKITSYEFLYPETIIPPTTTEEGVEDGCKDVYCEPTDIPMEEPVVEEDEAFNL
jgi:hypothetical protein